MMRKTLRLFYAVLLLSVAFSSLSVADAGIAVRFLDMRLDSTQHVSIGYTLTISAEVQNTDSFQSFQGALDFGLHNNQQELTTSGVFDKPPYSGNQIFLGPGEEVPAIFSVDIDDPYFMPGPDVVVVWPKSSSPVSDSIVINLLIIDPSAVEEKQQDEFSYLVTGSKIQLRYSGDKINFQQVRIYNMLGQQAAYYHSDLISDIPVPDLPRGVYLCEMITADKRTRVIKFFH